MYHLGIQPLTADFHDVAGGSSAFQPAARGKEHGVSWTRPDCGTTPLAPPTGGRTSFLASAWHFLRFATFVATGLLPLPLFRLPGCRSGVDVGMEWGGDTSLRNWLRVGAGQLGHSGLLWGSHHTACSMHPKWHDLCCFLPEKPEICF